MTIKIWTTDRTEKDSEVYIRGGIADIDNIFQSEFKKKELGTGWEES